MQCSALRHWRGSCRTLQHRKCLALACQASQAGKLGNEPSREELLDSIRHLKKGDRHRFWQPELDPPPALGNLVVVAVGTKKPPNIGAVARACNCFECGRLRVVEPACPLTTRSALNAAMGGQHLLWQTEDCGSVAEAVRDCAYSVAFSRWTGGDAAQEYFTSISGLVKALGDAGLLNSPTNTVQADNTPSRVAFVFGREVTGLTDSEVAACSAVCRLPMGRLAESLSLTHAVAIALSTAYEHVTCAVH